ncbi:hypothetical protein ARMGADRAFT_1033763 [Armillaria gallica]|uniref:Uncharacterized protein n=1 Tax=Armillaria gallica TaxID=47427 RepID=A0A2H3DI67_ARMGA|nr:hypothetical protein ARMGADRAFT_1033763 [Armillaria gallica]
MQKKQAKKKRQQQAKKKVTAQEDANAQEDKETQSMCPDLDMKRKGLPPPLLQAHTEKPFRKKTQPVDILPQIETPVILLPSDAFANIDRPDVDFGLSDKLPPISSVATLESEGIMDETMDIDIDEPPGSVHSEIMDTTYDLLLISLIWTFSKPNIASLAQAFAYGQSHTVMQFNYA